MKNYILHNALNANCLADLDIATMKECIVLMIDNEMSKLVGGCVQSTAIDVITSFNIGLCEECNTYILDELYARLGLDLVELYDEVCEQYDFN